MSLQDELANVIAQEINKPYKGQKVAYFLGKESSPTDIKEFISTGSSTLDLAISNRPNGGIAVGRITEINGLESTGKSLLGAHILAETQKVDGMAVYIDTETSVSVEFLNASGVESEKMLYLHLETVEEIFDAIEKIIIKVRESDKDKLVTILVDSLAAASTKVEMEADFDKDGWATSKAIIISKAMRKITQMIGKQRICLVFTNQLRQKLGVMFGDPWTTSGGKALPFHASTRIRLKNLGQIKDKKGDVIGMKIRSQIVKNRLGPPLRKADYEMYFDRGIANYDGWLHVLKEHKLITSGGAWYTIKDQNGEPKKFMSKDWEGMMEDTDFRDHVYDMICEKMILHYQENRGIDDVEFTDEVIGEE